VPMPRLRLFAFLPVLRPFWSNYRSWRTHFEQWRQETMYQGYWG